MTADFSPHLEKLLALRARLRNVMTQMADVRGNVSDEGSVSLGCEANRDGSS